ncbi:MAG: UDP-glucose 4-epimerase GalE [Sporichthyaceae bacterium]|nr:UDP-glucose 4-epimerase GalE [Sporichthyaceae bacterium]
MTWLVTGGAGYIGGHVVAALRAAGLPAVVLDDLSTGSLARVPADVPVLTVALHDFDAVLAGLRDHEVTGVIHLAAKKAVGESVERPLYYYRENVGGFEVLLRAIRSAGVSRLLLSSSASVYGNPDQDQVTEDLPLRPLSPYGQTKTVCEWMVAAAHQAYELGYVTLRYFNVVGAASRELADTGVFNLVPLALQAISAGRQPLVFGADYPTRDGTCIRDYVDVRDVADAHVAAARLLDAGKPAAVYNVGRGEGFTVKEVLAAIDRVTGMDVGYQVVDRRPGDPTSYCAAVDKIERELGWTARYTLDDMVASAWAAWPKP